MMSGRNRLAKAEAILVAAIERALPSLAQARELAERFQAMIRSGKAICSGRLAFGRSR